MDTGIKFGVYEKEVKALTGDNYDLGGFMEGLDYRKYKIRVGHRVMFRNGILEELGGKVAETNVSPNSQGILRGCCHQEVSESTVCGDDWRPGVRRRKAGQTRAEDSGAEQRVGSEAHKLLGLERNRVEVQFLLLLLFFSPFTSLLVISGITVSRQRETNNPAGRAWRGA
jgi:hypothetical protein